MSSTFFIPAVNIMGIDCLEEAMAAIAGFGLRKALIVTDPGLVKAGVAERIAGMLAMRDIDSVVFDGAKPNPSIANVEAGLALLHQARCDCVVSWAVARPTTVPRASPCAPPTAATSVITRVSTAPVNRNCR